MNEDYKDPKNKLHEEPEKPKEPLIVKQSALSLILKYGITFVFASLMAILALYLRDVFSGEYIELSLKYRYLADAFTIPAVFLLGCGCLVFLSNEGALNAVLYSLRWLGQSLIPLSKKEHLRYADYCERRKKVQGYAFLFHVGLLFLAVAIIFIVLFFQVYNK